VSALDTLYAITSLGSQTLEEEPRVWLTDDNYRRIHGALGGPPMQRRAELNQQTPYWDDVIGRFDPTNKADDVEQLACSLRPGKQSEQKEFASESCLFDRAGSGR
jgi:hypothetical protein